jgi:hypothetical protein
VLAVTAVEQVEGDWDVQAGRVQLDVERQCGGGSGVGDRWGGHVDWAGDYWRGQQRGGVGLYDVRFLLCLCDLLWDYLDCFGLLLHRFWNAVDNIDN